MINKGKKRHVTLWLTPSLPGTFGFGDTVTTPCPLEFHVLFEWALSKVKK